MEPIDSDKEYVEEYDEEYDKENDQDHVKYFNEDCDDHKEVPVQLREEIRMYIMDNLFPDILAYMSQKGHTEVMGVKIEHVSLQLLVYFYGLVEPFNREENYDLYIMHRALFGYKKYPKMKGRELVAAAIRLSTAIGKEEHAEKLKDIVKDCFIPIADRDFDAILPGYLD
jgi:hypothetical protein